MRQSPRFVLSIAFCLLSLTAALQAHAQAYPSHPIKIVVPFVPGGATDLIGRGLSEQMQIYFSQPVVVENKPGASTIIGTEAVIKSAPDGYTLLESGSSTYTVVPALKPNIPYDPEKNLALLGIVAKAPMVLVTTPGTTIKTVADLIAQAKARPGEITYSNYGAGSAPHLASEMFALAADIKLMAIPYKGSAPAMLAAMSGEINMAVETLAAALPQIKAGKLHALAIVSGERTPLLPEVPTLAEAGLPSATFEGWYAVSAPVGTPAPIQEKLVAALTHIMAIPAFRAKLEAAGLEPVMIGPVPFAEKVKNEIATYRAVAQKANIALD